MNICNKLDTLIQQIASKQRSQISFSNQNIVGHHIIRRHNDLYRWDLRNIAFITYEEHLKVHNQPDYEEQILTKEQKQFRDARINNQIKDYLINHCITLDDFMQEQYYKLRRELNK